MAIKPLTLPNGATIYVEVEDSGSEIPFPTQTPDANEQAPYLPPGAEHTSLPSLDDMVIGSKMLQETISGAAQNVYDSLHELKPDEWSVELNVGFESTDKGIISYLGKGSGSLKVTAKWKKADQDKADT